MAKNTLVCGGSHRGAKAYAQQLSPQALTLYDPTVLVADPKPGRAKQLSEVLRNRLPSLDPRALTMRIEDALALSRDHDSVVLALDDIQATSAVLASRRPGQHVTFQILGRGPGQEGTLIGIQGTLSPGDAQTQRSVSLLLPALSDMSRSASSRELTEPDLLTAVRLAPLRSVVSTRTALHLSEKGRDSLDLTGSPLSLTFGQSLFPLIAVEAGPAEKYSQQSDLALETAGSLPANAVFARGQSSGTAVVALVQARAVHFLRLAISSSGRRVVAGLLEFLRPVQRAAASTAVFTD